MIPERDELIREGYSLEEIAARSTNQLTGEVGISKERVRQYIHVTGRYKVWKEKREFCRTQKKNVKKELIATLVEIVKQKARGQDDFALEKAIEYDYSRKKRSGRVIPFEQLYELFRPYFEVQKEGTKLSIQALSKLSYIHPTSVGRVLRALNLDLMCRPRASTKKKVLPPKEKKEAIERAADLEMNAPDIAYFVRVPHWVATIHLKNIRKNRTKKYWCYDAGGNERLTYRAASQIYEAQDLSFDRDEISELLDIKPQFVDYALQNRGTIEAKIIHALDVIHQKKHDKPYLEK